MKVSLICKSYSRKKQPAREHVNASCFHHRQPKLTVCVNGSVLTVKLRDFIFEALPYENSWIG